MRKIFLGWNGIRGAYIKPVFYFLILIVTIPVVVNVCYTLTFQPSLDHLSEAEQRYVERTQELYPDRAQEMIISGSERHYSFVTWIMRGFTIIILIAIPYSVISYKSRIFPFLVSKAFYCEHCCKSIVPKNIRSFDCPNCHSGNRNGFDLIFSCSNCHDVIHKFVCPHCSEPINLIKPYNKKLILSKRYEQ